METNQREELRYAMETQFRYKFYKSPEFPFLPSLGLRHVFQGFEAKEEELGFMGYQIGGQMKMMELSTIIQNILLREFGMENG